MLECPRVYCLPLLHPSLERGALSCPPGTALRVWPGLPHMPTEGYWASASYPFAGDAAKSCVQQMEQLSEAALSGVPMQTLASMGNAPDVQKKRKELQDIDKFTRSGVNPPHIQDSAKVLEAAQKALLWAWLLEEKLLELKGIMGTYSDNAAHLMDALGVEADDHDTGLALLASLDRELDTSSPMLPPWPMVLENAAIFLPDNAVIAVTSEAMAADLRDRLTFSPASEACSALWQTADCGGSQGCVTKNCVLEQAHAPLWQALGKQGLRSGQDTVQGDDHCAEQPWRAKKFTFVLCGVQA